MIRVGFIGTGNMGSAIARALSANKEISIYLNNRTSIKAQELSEEINGICCDKKEIAACCDYIFIGVKPGIVPDVVKELGNLCSDCGRQPVFVSMAAGIASDKYYDMLGKKFPFIRIMPNTPVSVCEGVTLYSANDMVPEANLAEFIEFMSLTGRLYALDEKLFDAGSALTGCGPAFVDLFMESLADGAVMCGLPRKLAYEMTAALLSGSAKLMADTGKHPGELKDAVCSPAGSTIEGVLCLEENSFRAAVIKSVVASYTKTKGLGK